MRFDSVKKLKGEAFRRLTGVQRSTFEDMVGLLFAAKRRQKAAGGKPNTLCIEDQLLMMLEYWREYRTYFHIAQTHGISESAASGCRGARPFLRVMQPYPFTECTHA